MFNASRILNKANNILLELLNNYRLLNTSWSKQLVSELKIVTSVLYLEFGSITQLKFFRITPVKERVTSLKREEERERE